MPVSVDWRHRARAKGVGPQPSRARADPARDRRIGVPCQRGDRRDRELEVPIEGVLACRHEIRTREELRCELEACLVAALDPAVDPPMVLCSERSGLVCTAVRGDLRVAEGAGQLDLGGRGAVVEGVDLGHERLPGVGEPKPVVIAGAAVLGDQLRGC